MAELDQSAGAGDDLTEWEKILAELEKKQAAPEYTWSGSEGQLGGAERPSMGDVAAESPVITPTAERTASIIDFTPAAPPGQPEPPTAAVERYIDAKERQLTPGAGTTPGQYLPTGSAPAPALDINGNPFPRGTSGTPLLGQPLPNIPVAPIQYRGPQIPDWMKGIGEFASEAIAPTLGTPMGPGIAGAGAGLGAGFLGAVGRRLLPGLTKVGPSLAGAGVLGGPILSAAINAPAPPTPGAGYAGGGRVVPGVNAPALELTETPAGPGAGYAGGGRVVPGVNAPALELTETPTGPAPIGPAQTGVAPYSGPQGAPVSGLPPMFPAVAPAPSSGGRIALPGAKPGIALPGAKPGIAAPTTGGGGRVAAPAPIGGSAPTFGTGGATPISTATGPGTITTPFGAGPAQAVDLAGMTQQMGQDLQSLRQMVSNPSAPPDVIGMYVQGLQMIMATLDKSEQALRTEFAKNNSEIDPATQTVLNQLRETLKLDLKNTGEELNARGLYSSGILLDLEQKLRKGALSEESKVLNQRLTSMRDQLNASLTNISNQRFSSASSFGLAGIQGQQQANESAEDRRQNLIQLIAQQQMAMRGQLSGENQAGLSRAQDQSNADRTYNLQQSQGTLDQARLAEQQRQYNESFGMDKAKYNQDYAQREQQAALDRQTQLQIAGMPSRSSSGNYDAAATQDAINQIATFGSREEALATLGRESQALIGSRVDMNKLWQKLSEFPFPS